MTESRVVVLTGAANGIGRAAATGFHRDGFTVVGVDNDAGRLPLVAGACVMTVAVDVGDPSGVAAAVQAIVARLGRVDILVNGAGVILDRRVADHAEGEFERVVRTNLLGPFYFLRAVIPVMRRQRHGRVVNVASRSAEGGTPGLAAYGASKAAVLTLTRTTASEVASDGILVNALIPGETRTAINPAGTEEPEAVYPYVKHLATLRSDGPTGKAFLYGREYRLLEPPSDLASRIVGKLRRIRGR
jgi:3-oxoacyl-[acyl-carrier protein] reductase